MRNKIGRRGVSEIARNFTTCGHSLFYSKCHSQSEYAEGQKLNTG